MRMESEQITDAVAFHGEGPVWDDRVDQVVWVDMLRGDVLFTTPGGSTDRLRVGTVAACVVPRESGGYAFTTERAFGFLHGDEISVLPDLWDDPSVRMNDGACDPQGRFYCGSMAYDFGTGRGKLYRLELDGTVTTILDGVTISNGLAWSPEGTKAYYIDTPTQRVDRCAPDLSTRTPFVEFPPDTAPDGLTVDAEGGVWVALWGGSAVHRYAPDGVLDTVVSVAARQVTSCAFGGADLATLYISTSAENLADPEPGAGALFAVQPGVRGLPTLPYRG